MSAPCPDGRIGLTLCRARSSQPDSLGGSASSRTRRSRPSPDDIFETRWTYGGHRLRRRLARGERVVLHCMGGLGRTGTVAARLLVECGVAPEDAIGRVRVARPGAIEYSGQEEYVRRCAPVPRAGEPLTHSDRVLGCLLGGAVGDAFGYAIEFAGLSEIHRRYGADGLREPLLSKAGRTQVSDDTQMTLFTLEACLDALDGIAAPDSHAFVAGVRIPAIVIAQSDRS
jgi:ADP-ribosyl-[dinitrogen reductase] hydrolase